MARPGQLANAIAEVLGLDPATVRQQARLLRNAGHMTMEKGGRGAGSMSPRDAVNLLIAAAGSSRVKYSVRAVEQYGDCWTKDGSWHLQFNGLPELLELDAAHTFADALEALLRAAMDGSINSLTGDLKPVGSSGELLPRQLGLSFEIAEPFTKAKIIVGIQGFDDHHARIIEKDTTRKYESRIDADGSVHPALDTAGVSDLTHIHHFTEKTIYRIAREFIDG